MEQAPAIGKSEDIKKEVEGEKTFKSLGEALDRLGEVREIKDSKAKLQAWLELKNDESFQEYWNGTIKTLLSEDDHEEMIKEFGAENV